ncbi:hypothetical protein L1N85_07410 [Paenibacillus alkaliterrae]|nr:hypothetical protein [Paenibacillus alkaliterrae]MCF2938260.1 hypothetical protein [Paenibacillus alkaliterrae]
MVLNKNGKADGHRIHTSVREHSRTLPTNKFAKRPPSLNGINKQLP